MKERENRGIWDKMFTLLQSVLSLHEQCYTSTILSVENFVWMPFGRLS